MFRYLYLVGAGLFGVIASVCLGIGSDDWDRKSLENAIQQAGEFPIEKPDDVLVKEEVTYDTRKLTQQFESVVAFQPNADVLWPGSLVQGKTLQSGILTSIPVRGEDRVPGKIVLTGVAGAKVVEKEIAQPSLGTVQQAVNDLILSNLLEDQVQPANASFSLHKVYTLDQAMLRLGASAQWMGGSVQANFRKQIQENKASVLVRFMQSYYAVSFEPPDSPSMFILTKRGAESLRQRMSPAINDIPTNPPVYVASVTYGRELWALISSQESEETLETSLKASFSGLVAKGTVEAETKNRHVLRESKVNVFVLGSGLAEATPILLGDQEKGLEGYIRSGASFSRKSPGAVITYQTRYLGTGNVAKLSSVTQYTVPR
jgi:hypothetical protein